MMVSLTADYALRAVLLLARPESVGAISADEIALATGVLSLILTKDAESRRAVFRHLLWMAGAAAAAFLLISGLMWVLFDYPTFAVMQTCSDQQHQFNIFRKRTYWKWLIGDVAELLVAAGPALVVVISISMRSG